MKITAFSAAWGEREVFKNFSIEFTDGTVTAIMGPSGCGKTTLLHHIAFDPARENAACVFQEHRLLPWMTIETNIMLTLKKTVPDKTEARQRTRDYLERVGLGNRLAAWPDELSGGERQRASIARAFASRTGILLMDEPFQSQDITTKLQLLKLVAELQIKEKRTVLMATHDPMEAATLAQRVIVLSGKPATIKLDSPVCPGVEQEILKALAG